MMRADHRRRVLLSAGVAAVCLLHGSVLSQVRQDGSWPEALNGIKPAGGMCRRDELVPPGATGLYAPGAVSDLGCAIAPTDLKSIMAEPAIALMDLRTSAEYHGVHLEGALNLQLPDLIAKPYWRRKNVVLVGNGKAERELLAMCSQLRQAGYENVRVLRGGMPAWLVHQYPVAGQVPASVAQYVTLTAAELWLEGQNSSQLIMLDPSQITLQDEFPAAVLLPGSSTAEVKGVLERRRKDKRIRQPATSAVMIADPGISPEQIEALLRAVSPLALLVYHGTPSTYRLQVKQQQAVWQAQARGPRQPGCGL